MGSGRADSLVRGKDGLFVKNLENVQGDERDVIIFSTGFAKTASGVLPLNFGPLNRTGGERRLNVAITRARRRVMVFSSFEPEDLRVEQTSSASNTCAPISSWPSTASGTSPPEQPWAALRTSSATATARPPADVSTLSTATAMTLRPLFEPRVSA